MACDHAAKAAIVSINEIEEERRLDELQNTLSWLGIIPGPIGFFADLTNAAISLSRGNYRDAVDHVVYAIPYVGLGYAGFQISFAFGYNLVTNWEVFPDGFFDLTELPIEYRVGSKNSADVI